MALSAATRRLGSPDGASARHPQSLPVEREWTGGLDEARLRAEKKWTGSSPWCSENSVPDRAEI
jgi:hypothetical protein